MSCSQLVPSGLTYPMLSGLELGKILKRGGVLDLGVSRTGCQELKVMMKKREKGKEGSGRHGNGSE